MQKHAILLFATFALAGVAFGQYNSGDGFYQLGYAANLNIGDSVVNLTNDGINGGVFGNTGVAGNTGGNICANVYVFDPQEEEIGCCSCLVTPNGLNSLSAVSDLISNNLTPAVPTSIVIKILGSLPTVVTPATTFSTCNAATAGTTALTALEYGLVAWGSTLEPTSTGGTYSPVNVPYKNGQLAGLFPGVPPGGGAIGVTATNGFLRVAGTTFGTIAPVAGTELAALTSLCSFIQADGTGYGICKSCRLGALGGAKQ